MRFFIVYFTIAEVIRSFYRELRYVRGSLYQGSTVLSLQKLIIYQTWFHWVHSFLKQGVITAIFYMSSKSRSYKLYFLLKQTSPFSGKFVKHQTAEQIRLLFTFLCLFISILNFIQNYSSVSMLRIQDFRFRNKLAFTDNSNMFSYKIYF